MNEDKDDVIGVDYALSRAIERARVDNDAQGWAAVAIVLHVTKTVAIKTTSGFVLQDEFQFAVSRRPRGDDDR